MRKNFWLSKRRLTPSKLNSRKKESKIVWKCGRF